MELRRWWFSRSLPVQLGLLGLGTAAAAGAVAAASTSAWPWIAACAGSALSSALVAALWAQRQRRTLGELAAGARRLAAADDDSPPLPGEAPSDEIDFAARHLRAMVESYRERVRALTALNAALGQRLSLRTQELTSLQDLSIGLAESTSVRELVDEALRALEQTVEYASASVWSRATDGARPEVTLLGYRSAGDDSAQTADQPMAGMRLSRAHLRHYEQIERERTPMVDNDVRQSLLSWLWTHIADDSRTSKLHRTSRSWAALPLRVRDAVIGVLRVDHGASGYFEPERVRLLAAVASQTALAMRHANLQEMERANAVVAERNRIARDLHDAVSQTLFAAHMIATTLLQRAQRTAAAPDWQESADTLERLTRGALAELRLLMFELRPDALEGARLPDLLRQAAGTLAARSDCAVALDIDDTLEVTPKARTQVYRIAQEALGNAARHSQARHVEVAFARRDSKVRLVVADDGCGFDPLQDRPGHFGVGNMGVRAAEIGAALQVTSVPDEGTRVELALDDSCLMEKKA
jgi:signal transduction histidine kinase